MSSCLSSRACGLDLEHMIKWSYNSNSSRTITSNSSSPSSTLSESSNSTIATRKPRTPRKRPNQTYNEAAALLSMACPNIFTTKNLPKFSKNQSSFFNKSPELVSVFPMIENPGFLIQSQSMEKPCFLVESKVPNMCQNVGEVESKCVYEERNECLDDFDTESILDEEIEQGIDSIMGESSLLGENGDKANSFSTCYGYPVGLGFGVRNGVRALRKCGERNWSNCPMVDVVSISPPVVVAKCQKVKGGKKTKKKRTDELMKWGLELKREDFKSADDNAVLENGHGLGLKLDYDAVLNAWSDKGSRLPKEISPSFSSGGDIHARAANIDLFSKNGKGWVESGDNNNIKKMISKQHVKNVSTDRRPRCKGRFVRKPTSTACDEET